ncbi:Outer envelope pore protein 16-2 [Citrus sinensis]|uniref:Outer envelope pore protein 16-2 n=1 Tax=Citrus sinensis TaxID=2711 RepID=A0ACB8IAE6_CITSI|nr:Outer envelope pore protein 16-2 [Citrus sinensis]
MTSNMENRSLFHELPGFEKGGFFDLGHPLLNRITESFVKAAGIGAIQAVTREAYFTAVEGETNRKSLEAMVKNTGKESLQWGVVAGIYSGLTYGLREARGAHDWKNSAVAGAITGVALALTIDDSSHEQVVQCAITGAAISTAANLLTGIF